MSATVFIPERILEVATIAIGVRDQIANPTTLQTDPCEFAATEWTRLGLNHTDFLPGQFLLTGLAMSDVPREKISRIGRKIGFNFESKIVLMKCKCCKLTHLVCKKANSSSAERVLKQTVCCCGKGYREIVPGTKDTPQVYKSNDRLWYNGNSYPMPNGQFSNVVDLDDFMEDFFSCRGMSPSH